MKLCKKCGCSKSYAEFFSDKSKKDGFSTTCKVCKTLAQKTWNSRNTEKVKSYKAKYASDEANRSAKNAQAKVYRASNAEAISAYQRKRWSENKEAVYAINRNWWLANPQRTAQYKQKRRVAHLNAFYAPTECDVFLIEEVYDLRNRRNLLTGMHWEVDHIIPLTNVAVCGLHAWWNLQVIPRRDNRVKKNKFLQENAIAFSRNGDCFAATLAPR